MRKRSPAGPPLMPALPLPCRRMRWPSRVPGLMRNSTVSVRVTMPSPWQVGQSFEIWPRAVAARAGDVELHAAAHLRHLARAVALGTLCAASDVRLAMAGGAGLLAIDLDARLAAADGGPEVDRGLILEVGAGLRASRTLLRMLRAGKNAGKNISEAARAAAPEALLSCPGPPEKSEKSKPPKSMGGWPEADRRIVAGGRRPLPVRDRSGRSRSRPDRRFCASSRRSGFRWLRRSP